jgi:hypothetical protein
MKKKHEFDKSEISKNNETDTFFNKENKKNKIYDLYLQNNKQYNNRIVFELIDLELKSKENTGQQLTQEYLSGKLEREICLSNLHEQGFNKWWGNESLWYVIHIEKYSITQNSPITWKLIADCIMEYVNNKVIFQHQKQKTKKSKISLEFNVSFSVSKFHFSWDEQHLDQY